MYVGPTIRVFFEEEKPALLQQIDAEIEKVLLSVGDRVLTDDTTLCIFDILNFYSVHAGTKYWQPRKLNTKSKPKPISLPCIIVNLDIGN